MKIQNYNQLATTDLRKKALLIAEAGLHAIDTEKVLKENVKFQNGTLVVKSNYIDTDHIENIYFVGIGKNSVKAAEIIEEMMGNKIRDGIALDVASKKLGKIKTIAGTHPFPSEKNMQATKEIIDLLNQTTENDLVIFVVSGGGSALLCQPNNNKCEDEVRLIDFLFSKGADIYEVNKIRKHLSLARGGHLAKYAHPAKVVSLIFSDIPGDDLEFVASGPTYKDSTTVEDAKKVITKYGLDPNTYSFIETPKEDMYFERVSNILLVSNKVAVETMIAKAEELGYKTESGNNICKTCLSGNAQEIGKEVAKALSKTESRTALIYGGETTIKKKGNGKGGRNQELALAALVTLQGNELIIALASDGWDNTDAAGAISDTETLKKAQKQNLNIEDYLKNNDSYTFYEKTGDHIFTGLTHSNVADLVIALKD